MDIQETIKGWGKIKATGFFDTWIYDPDTDTKSDFKRHRNSATLVGLNSMLSTTFNSGTQITLWYVGIIDSVSYSNVSSADTMASHAGWAEFTDYAAANRPTWTPAAPSGGIIYNTTAFSFVLTSNMNAKGMFLVSNNTKGGSTGTLFATALGDRNALSGQTVQGAYTITLTPG